MAKKNQEKKKAGELFQYDAFISYRHQDPDKSVAEELHRQLESFKMPKNVEASLMNGHTKIERVFRDEDELPIASSLENSIVTALENSEWLIVICSPRLIESEWCRLEIKNFIRMHGRDHVLAVLVEGEPEDSFPPELVYEETEFVDEAGITRTEKKYIEPLAADIRGKNKKEILKNISSQKMRLIASMFNLNYDDLKQRHRERKIKRRIALLSGIAIAATLVGALSLVMLLRINSQKNQIEAQNEEILAQTLEIEAQNQQLLIEQSNNLAEISLNYLEDNDRARALEVALEATYSDEIDIPYTASGELALASATYAYGEHGQLSPFQIVETPGEITHTELSADGSFLMVQDSSYNLTIFDTRNMQQVALFSNVYESSDLKSTARFLDNNRIVFLQSETNATTYSGIVFNCQTQQITTLDNPLSSNYSMSFASELVTICGDGEHFLIVSGNDDILIYDINTLQCVGNIPASTLTQVDPINPFGASAPVEEPSEAEEEPSEDAEAPEEEATPDATIPGEDGNYRIESVAYGSDYIVVILSNYTNGTSSYYIKIYDSHTYELLKNYKTGNYNVMRAFIQDGILYYGECNTDEIQNLQINVKAINLSTNEVVWTTSSSGYISAFYHGTIGNRDYIIYKTYMTLTVIDMADGSIVTTFAENSDIVGLYVYPTLLRIITGDNTNWYITFDNGDVGEPLGMPLTTSETANFSGIEINFNAGNIIYAVNARSNTFTIYQEVLCRDLVPLTSSSRAVGQTNYGAGGEYLTAPDNTLEYFNSIYHDGNEELLADLVEEFGIQRADTISSILLTFDGEYAIVNRSNYTFDIYASDGTTVGEGYTLSHSGTVDKYYGTDENGNIYIAGILSDGIKISPDGEVLAYIPMLCGLDANNNLIVRIVDGTCMTQPIYTFEELIEMAQDALQD